MPLVRVAAARAMNVDVEVEGMVALMREAGTGRFIDAMLDLCRTCVGADFVSIFAYPGAGVPALVGTATTTAAENARKAAVGYMQHFASDVNFVLMSRRRIGTYVTYQTADEIASLQYRCACYDRTGIADRLFTGMCRDGADDLGQRVSQPRQWVLFRSRTRPRRRAHADLDDRRGPALWDQGGDFRSQERHD